MLARILVLKINLASPTTYPGMYYTTKDTIYWNSERIRYTIGLRTSFISTSCSNLLLVWRFDKVLPACIPPIVTDFTERMKLGRIARAQFVHPLAWRQRLFSQVLLYSWQMAVSLVLKIPQWSTFAYLLRSVICEKAIKSPWVILLCPCSVSN